ncbi:surface-adhesin E family protein [Limnohabitans sp.]|uniref:surface-adhesin E family protein n=1 Tax=Limnohabitans sp. TaxID=1907725 RepID=UPI00333F72B7
MKFIALFLLALASTASHAMWVTVTRNEVATVYIDSSAIVKMGYNRRVWVVYDLTSPDKTGQQSVKSYIDYDCTEGKYKTLSASSHPNKMGNGPAIKALPVAEGWKPVSQDSMSRQLFAFACAW